MSALQPDSLVLRKRDQCPCTQNEVYKELEQQLGARPHLPTSVPSLSKLLTESEQIPAPRS